MFVPQVEQEFKRHVLEEFPRECVGVVVDGQYQRMENESETPLIQFRLSSYPHDAQAVLHSHTQSASADPQEQDMRSQQSHGVPWGISHTNGRTASAITWFGDQVPVAPYVGRTFVNGQQDCWCLIRDIYRITLGVGGLPNIPRDDDWFKGNNPRDLLSLANIGASGFYRISQNELRPWDIALGSIASRVTNHCGIYIGRNQMLHHVEGHPSCRVLINPWKTRIRHYLRHETLRDATLPDPKEILG